MGAGRKEKLMDNGEKHFIGPNDLLPGQEKVVSYVGADYTVIVPDKEWNMTGDLSRLPQKVQEILRHYSKNGFRKEQAIVDTSTRSLRIPSGSKVLNDIASIGYSVDGSRVVFLGEFDSRGNRIS